MKNWIGIFGLFVAISGFSQITYVGVKAGGHAGSSFIEHTIFNTNVRSRLIEGINMGVFAKFLPKKNNSFLNSGIQLGVNYVQKGWRQVFITDEPAYTARMTYLEVPVEGIGYFGNKNKYFISAGFFMEFLVDTDLDAEPNPNNLGGGDFWTYDADRDRKIGYGGRLSGGIFRDFSFGSIQLEGFFSYSFSNFMNPGDLTTEVPDISNLWVGGATLGYMFRLGKEKVK